MKKTIKFVIMLVILMLVLTLPVHAISWNSIFKTGVKQTEKQAIKQTEKSLFKQEGETAIRRNQIRINNLNGNLLENTFKLKWCNLNNCASTIYEVNRNIRKGRTFYISNDYTARKFINKEFDKHFTRKPDMMKVSSINGKVNKVVIYDVKTSNNAIKVSSKRGQTEDYHKLCDSLNKKYQNGFCDIQYVLPEKEAKTVAKTNGEAVVGCLIVGLIMVPDPTDLLCFVGG